MQLNDYLLSCRVWTITNGEIYTQMAGYAFKDMTWTIAFDLQDIPNVPVGNFFFIEIFNKNKRRLFYMKNITNILNNKTYIQVYFDQMYLHNTKISFDNIYYLNEVIKNFLLQKMKENPFRCSWIQRILWISKITC